MLQPSGKWAATQASAPSAPTRYLSPLRYPGAKSKLTAHIAALISSARDRGHLRAPLTLVEPFAGGASTTLRLLTDGVVDRAILGDADPLLASFWAEAATAPERLIERMTDEHAHVTAGGSVAIARWDHWRAWQPGPADDLATVRRELAVKCLFLNRTTFSGILHGSAGPIGGRAQESAYAIGCRFPLDGLAERIRWIGHLATTQRLVFVAHAGWRDTLEFARDCVDDARSLVAYLDPPYVEKSDRLYATGFDGSGYAPDVWRGIGPHQALAEYLRTEASFRWILSYDDHPELLGNVLLYGRRRTTPTAVARSRGAAAWAVSRSKVRLQHSTSAQSARQDVEELLLSTL